MKFLKEDFEDEFDSSEDLPMEDDLMIDEPLLGDEVADYAEIEMTLAEPSKLVDADGSVVLVGAGDIVTIQSESLKRIKHSNLKEGKEPDDYIDMSKKDFANLKKKYPKMNCTYKDGTCTTYSSDDTDKVEDFLNNN